VEAGAVRARQERRDRLELQEMAGLERHQLLQEPALLMLVVVAVVQIQPFQVLVEQAGLEAAVTAKIMLLAMPVLQILEVVGAEGVLQDRQIPIMPVAQAAPVLSSSKLTTKR